MRVHFLRLCVLGLAAAALACGGSGSSKPKKGGGGKPDASTAPPKEEAVKLDLYWDDPSYIVLGDQSPCPEGFWALFGGDPPGATKEEQKANLAKKPELKKALEAKTFLVHMQSGDEVSLGDYSNAKGELDINVKATVLCKSPSLENVTIAFGPVKPQLPPGRDFGQYFWLGDPVKFPVKVPFSQVPEFKSKHRLDLDARIVFTMGKPEQHKKLIKSTETAEEKAERKKFDIPGRAGGMDDWGAGWVMHAEVKGVRVAADRGKTELAAIKH
ncbi:MAG TPA: hypothetical protein VFA20_35535 [Myxococcaceae bacterium]|nr:hypothetical protein [Myxococcaceae bacterium]